MTPHPLDFLSGLAYLAVCLLIAASGARKKCGESTPENGGARGRLSLSCLISLISFLFMPCGKLPSLLPFSGAALVVIGGLIAALGFRGWGACRGVWVPLSLGVSLAVIARYGEQRGIPGELFTLDAYVAMPVFGAVEGMGKAGVWFLGAASLFALWASCGKKSSGGDRSPPDALAAELWALAAIGFWICLFFPFSFAYSGGSEGFGLAGLALDALVFWGKVLGLNWGLNRWPGKFHGTWIQGAVPLALLGIGAGLLLGAAAE